MGVSKRGVSTRLVSAAAAAALLLFSGHLAAASRDQSAQLPRIDIGNFGRINDNFYRGEQPDPADYGSLAKLGVKTVINLIKGGDPDEQRLVESAGMKFYAIPMTTSDRPSDAAVTKFLGLVNNPANLPVYVHCKGGRHRTGVMTAVYRMTKDGWSADQAFAEMKKYRFEGAFDFILGHAELKDFVFDYYRQLQSAAGTQGK
jgi:protein tyrosine/serine phosphatase